MTAQGELVQRTNDGRLFFVVSFRDSRLDAKAYRTTHCTQCPLFEAGGGMCQGPLKEGGILIAKVYDPEIPTGSGRRRDGRVPRWVQQAQSAWYEQSSRTRSSSPIYRYARDNARCLKG